MTETDGTPAEKGALDTGNNPALRAIFGEDHPLISHFGLEVLEIDKGLAVVRLPYRSFMIGNPETGVLHGGVVTTLIDSACGIAVFTALPRLQPIATLDLRIDYMRPSTPNKWLHARARVTRVTPNVAFVTAEAWHEGEDGPIATAAGSFMIGTKVTHREDAE
ncbi:PaaI family thioesterase [Tistrella mobilis]|uniref:Thioesterase domain-containing protein n=1 Tax=Tistrella mobilis TaxID=171437 RepID=A0A162JLS3_9PROT|nr:PaaI family thioesterase [Tistrella mobilis]KYO49448.1 hypothetical protein AUP44_17430 [Tistrella mobilis]